MGQPAQDAAGELFARMETKAREIIERRFRVRLGAAASTEQHQAAWDVYQSAALKFAQALDAGAEIADPEAYAATVARHACSDYWRAQAAEWYELKGRLYRFFRKQPAWELWTRPDVRGPVCGPAAWRDRAMATGNRVAALLDKPRLISSRMLPKAEVFQELAVTDWDRLLNGAFSYLEGPVRLDALVSIAGALFGVQGSRELAYDDAAPGGAEEDRPAWEPPARPASTLDAVVIREQIGRVWSEAKTMPQRWLIPFLLNPPTLAGSPGQRAPAEIGVFTANGFTTVAEIGALIGFTGEQYNVLWTELAIEAHGGPALASIPGAAERFAVVWNYLPLEDSLIARLMSLDSAQKVVNLRMVAKTHLAKVLRISEKSSQVR